MLKYAIEFGLVAAVSGLALAALFASYPTANYYYSGSGGSSDNTRAVGGSSNTDAIRQHRRVRIDVRSVRMAMKLPGGQFSTDSDSAVRVQGGDSGGCPD